MPSLNHEQWLQMWGSIKKIERDAKILNTDVLVRQRVLNECSRIKSLIESVIGQME